MLQNNVNFEILEDNTTELDDASYVQLYGRSPYIASYTLRVLFLHLLQYITDTHAVNELTESILVVCLLDMVRVYLCGGGNDSGRLCHPLIKGHFTGNYVDYKADFNIKHLISCLNNTHMDELGLLNYDNKVFGCKHWL